MLVQALSKRRKPKLRLIHGWNEAGKKTWQLLFVDFYDSDLDVPVLFESTKWSDVHARMVRIAALLEPISSRRRLF
jgi:hypothetical protein